MQRAPSVERMCEIKCTKNYAGKYAGRKHQSGFLTILKLLDLLVLYLIYEVINHNKFLLHLPPHRGLPKK